MKKVAFIPGRFSPPHKGHIMAFLWLLTKFDKIVVGIGSCYEVGKPRHPLLAFYREKMIRWSLINEGVDMSRVSFVHLQDFNDWDQWWESISKVAAREKVTHFVTGNEEDILNVMKEKGLDSAFEILNPEKEIPAKYKFEFHATDLRNAIQNGDYESFKKIAAYGTVALMGNVGGFGGIRDAMNDKASKFVEGRQAVDLIITCRPDQGKKMVLCGYRKKDKKDFPGWLALPGGGIDTFENPMDAAVRELEEETGLSVKIVNSYLEPAHVLVNGIISEMRFVGLFGSEDETLSGTEGGSSQVFHVELDVDQDSFRGMLKSDSDLDDVDFRPVDFVLEKGLAYQQSDMLRDVLRHKLVYM